MTRKSPDAFRTISEVAEWLDTPAHVLRFWESKFSQVKPVKRAGGRRYYRPGDMLLLGGIKKLLHEDGMTIKGAQKMLREEGVKKISALSQPLDAASADTRKTKKVPVADTAVEKPVADVSPITAEPKQPETAPDPVPDAAAKDMPPPGEIIQPALPMDVPAASKLSPKIITTPSDPDDDSKQAITPNIAALLRKAKDLDKDALAPIYDRLQVLHSRMKTGLDQNQTG